MITGQAGGGGEGGGSGSSSSPQDPSPPSLLYPNQNNARAPLRMCAAGALRSLQGGKGGSPKLARRCTEEEDQRASLCPRTSAPPPPPTATSATAPAPVSPSSQPPTLPPMSLPLSAARSLSGKMASALPPLPSFRCTGFTRSAWQGQGYQGEAKQPPFCLRARRLAGERARAAGKALRRRGTGTGRRPHDN